MRTALLAAVLALVAGLAFAAPPSSKTPDPKGAKPAGSATPKPAASPAPAKPAEPGRNECTGMSKDGSYSATANDYQACLREITNAVKEKSCTDGVKSVDFVFHRGGQKPVPQTAVCN